eukprot:750266-Hanusia_phi.AAC.1
MVAAEEVEVDSILAICSTMKNPSKGMLQSWLSYHFSIGFSLVLLFLDDPSDEQSALISQSVAKQFRGEVYIRRNNEQLSKEWEARAIFAEYKDRLDDQMARQILNADLAISMARQRNVSWLLHIDSDELFFTPSLDVRPHFDMLSSKRNIYQVGRHPAVGAGAHVGDRVEKEVESVDRAGGRKKEGHHHHHHHHHH